MTNHAVVTKEEHRDLRVKTDSSAELGDGVMACFTVPDEFRRLQNEFAILFRRDAESRAFSALALMGFEEGENLYLADGEWSATYKPLALAIQPFLVGRPAGGEGPGQVHIDLDSPRVSTDGEGTRLFDDSGLASPYLDRIAGMLGALDEGHRNSPDFFAAMERYELLEPFSLDVELNDGAKHRMVGYHMVNEDRLAELGAGEIAELHKGGHLEPLFMAIASLSNLNKLVDWKSRRVNG
ncbi:SapC family protein [Sphingomonas sabuli]|uniref:SapC family protein n=1 Tax=Sphingomonas sabuli TaxID=2764186 RepID=A0A7G9KZA9_9SPHN|nr:SapC family protein [Sphingomonas sabuli]QNM81708.1 SapC family protein [Sphingomonas sabuli]